MKTNTKHLLFLFALCLLADFRLFGSHSTDLEKSPQSFVLETKQIKIPGYPDAFNPGIIRWDGKLLMSFRARDPSTDTANLVGLVWLDEDFNPVSIPQILTVDRPDVKNRYIQDARFIEVDHKLYIVYSDLWQLPHKLARRVCVAELTYNGFSFKAAYPEFLLDFDGDENNKFEKNWVPFEYNDYLLLSYTIFPHKVFLPLFGERKCVTVDYSEGLNHWKWGDVRGGSPALKVDHQYLSFFHSSKVISSVQSEGKPITHYFMGAYTFSSQPPFKINKISPEPIVGRNFYNGKAHQTWKPLRVVFPMGFVFDEKYIWVTYGRQDYEVWVVKLDKQGLLKSLVPVE